MDRTLDQFRLLIVGGLSSILAYFTPTMGFIVALALTFAFNVIAGMRADGITIIRCKNFSIKKFKGALIELLLYSSIIWMVFALMERMGDKDAAVITAKTITYICVYVYVCNGFKNLIKAYPLQKALRIIYYVLRLEFKRALPANVQEIVDRVDLEIKRKEVEKSDDENDTKRVRK